MSTNYDELAARAERGELLAKPGTVRRGPELADEAKQMLAEVIGDEIPENLLSRPAGSTAS